jgi:FkbM family methyltransferase
VFNSFWKSVERGEWEPYTFEVLDRFVTSETNVIDIGAWIGPVTLYAAHTAKHVYAVEPDPVAFKELSALSSVPNVSLFNQAILNRNGKVTLGGESLGSSTTRIGCDTHAFEAPCITIESFVDGNKIDGPLFIKMDVEGAEELILESSFFEEYRPTLYLSVHGPLYRNPQCVETSLSELRSLYKNYECVEEGNYGALLFS